MSPPKLIHCRPQPSAYVTVIDCSSSVEEAKSQADIDDNWQYMKVALNDLFGEFYTDLQSDLNLYDMRPPEWDDIWSVEVMRTNWRFEENWKEVIETSRARLQARRQLS